MKGAAGTRSRGTPNAWAIMVIQGLGGVGTLKKRADGVKPPTLDPLRRVATVLVAAPWTDAPDDPSSMTRDELAAAYQAIPPGVMPRQGTSLSLDEVEPSGTADGSEPIGRRRCRTSSHHAGSNRADS